MARKKKVEPYPWSAEERTHMLFSGFESSRKARFVEKEMISFAHSALSPSECHTPVGAELLKLQTLINAALATPVLPDRPKLFLNVAYGGFSIRDPFAPREPRALEDEPLFAREKPDIKEDYLVAHGYVEKRLRYGDYSSSWHIDPDRELEKYLTMIAEAHFPLDLYIRKHLIGPQPERPRKRFRLW